MRQVLKSTHVMKMSKVATCLIWSSTRVSISRILSGSAYQNFELFTTRGCGGSVGCMAFLIPISQLTRTMSYNSHTNLTTHPYNVLQLSYTLSPNVACSHDCVLAIPKQQTSISKDCMAMHKFSLRFLWSRMTSLFECRPYMVTDCTKPTCKPILDLVKLL